MSLARKPPADGLFRQLAAETNESAAVGLFLDLCRSSPALRHWLWEDFARDASFRRWVLHHEPESTLFWNEWLKLNPDCKETARV